MYTLHIHPLYPPSNLSTSPFHIHPTYPHPSSLQSPHPPPHLPPAYLSSIPPINPLHQSHLHPPAPPHLSSIPSNNPLHQSHLPPPLSPTHLSYIPSNNPLHQSHLTPTPTLLFPPPIYPLFHPSIFSVEEIQVQVTKKIFCLKWYVKWNTGAKLWIHTKFHNFLLAARVLRSLRAKWCLSNKGLKMKAYTFSYQSGCCNFKLCTQNTTITAQWDGGLSTSIYLVH